nr:hypothetical protein [Tanacetum cinerariifolium]
MNVHDSAILEDSLPPKGKDPGSFTIPCYINNICFKKALADLGASISVMPYTTFINLGLGKLAPTKLIIGLADRTIKRPKGIAENVFVGIDKIPFLSTAHAKIDVFKRKITLKVVDDKIMFKNNNPTISIIRRVYALGLRERIELDLKARLMGEALILKRSLDHVYGYYIELNNLNEPLELRRNQIKYLGPTIEDGEIINEPMENRVKTRNDNKEIEGINEYPSFFVENMDVYRDEEMGDIIVGKPFCREIYVKTRRFDGMITIYNGNDSVTYQMARSHPRFKHLTNEQCNKIRSLLKVSAQDELNGISHPYQKLKSCYQRVLDLGPEYLRDAKVEERLTRGHVM